jgi:hypothetical protein
MISKLMVELCSISYKENFEKCTLQKNIQFQNICTKYNIKINNIICVKHTHTAFGGSHIVAATAANIIQSRDFCIVVFKGTDNVFDMVADINFFPKSTPVGVVHRGFYNIFEKIYPDLKKHLDNITKKIFLTGHSLGAALAVLCSAHFRHKNPLLITFGSPRVGAKSFIDYVSKDVEHIRWENTNDIVCYYPFFYRHFGEKRSVLFGNFFNKNHGSKYYKKIICTKCTDYYENENVIKSTTNKNCLS